MAALFTIVLLNVLVGCEVVLSPVVLALFAAIQVNVVSVVASVVDVSGILTVAPLHIVATLVLVIVGSGFTVTFKTWATPVLLHVGTGITVYVTV